MFFKNAGSGWRSCRANFQFSFFPTNLVILLFLLFALFLSFPNLIYFFYICSYRTWTTKILGTFYFVLRAFHSFWESGLEINPGSEPMPLMGGEILWLCRASSWAHRLSLFSPYLSSVSSIRPLEEVQHYRWMQLAGEMKLNFNKISSTLSHTLVNARVKLEKTTKWTGLMIWKRL